MECSKSPSAFWTSLNTLANSPDQSRNIRPWVMSKALSHARSNSRCGLLSRCSPTNWRSIGTYRKGSWCAISRMFDAQNVVVVSSVGPMQDERRKFADKMIGRSADLYVTMGDSNEPAFQRTQWVTLSVLRLEALTVHQEKIWHLLLAFWNWNDDHPRLPKSAHSHSDWEQSSIRSSYSQRQM